MKIDDNKITFEIDSDTLDFFKLAISKIDSDPDFLFVNWVRELTNAVLNKKSNIIGKPHMIVGTPSIKQPGEKINNEIVQSRIARWIRNQRGFGYEIVSIFFDLYNNNPRHIVKRQDMMDMFIKRNARGEDTSKEQTMFLTIFRQMCSDSPTAYGLIFQYLYRDENDIVTLHPLNETFLLEHKEEFILN